MIGVAGNGSLYNPGLRGGSQGYGTRLRAEGGEALSASPTVGISVCVPSSIAAVRGVGPTRGSTASAMRATSNAVRAGGTR